MLIKVYFKQYLMYFCVYNYFSIIKSKKNEQHTCIDGNQLNAKLWEYQDNSNKNSKEYSFFSFSPNWSPIFGLISLLFITVKMLWSVLLKTHNLYKWNMNGLSFWNESDFTIMAQNRQNTLHAKQERRCSCLQQRLNATYMQIGKVESDSGQRKSERVS